MKRSASSDVDFYLNLILYIDETCFVMHLYLRLRIVRTSSGEVRERF